MTNDTAAELARLERAVRAAPAGDPTAEIALWRYVAGLDRWYFIARGSAEQPRPYAIAARQGPMICVYSSAERAEEAARGFGMEGPVPTFTVPLPAALDYVAAFSQSGVFGVTVDHPRLGHFVPLGNLALLKRG